MSNPIEKPAASPELLALRTKITSRMPSHCEGSDAVAREIRAKRHAYTDVLGWIGDAIAAEEARKPTAPASLIERAAACSDGNSSHKTLQAIVDDVAKAEPAADVEAQLRDRVVQARTLSQLLIEEVGASGPESLPETVGRAIRVIRQLRTERDEAVARAEKEESYHREFFNRAQDAELKLREAEASGDDKLRKLRKDIEDDGGKWVTYVEGRTYIGRESLLQIIDRLLAEPAAEAKGAPEPERDDGPLRRYLTAYHDSEIADMTEVAVAELCRRALEGGGNG